MKKLTLSLAGILLSAISGLIYAGSDVTTLNLKVTFVNSLRLIGTVVGATKIYTLADIRSATNRRGPHPTITLGTLGIQSNNPGTCTLSFSTQNNFRLRHTETNRRLANYRLEYNGNRINRRRNLEMDLPCNSTPSPLDFKATGNIRNNIGAGVYSDTVTITVATQ